MRDTHEERNKYFFGHKPTERDIVPDLSNLVAV